MAKVNPLIKPPDRFSRATVTASVVVVVDHNGRADTCPVIRITPDSGLDESQEAFLRHVRRTPLPAVLVRLRSRPIFRKRTPLRATVRARARAPAPGIHFPNKFAHNCSRPRATTYAFMQIH